MQVSLLPKMAIVVWSLALSIVVSSGGASMAAAGPNVLFIAVDDLRPELGCYGAAHVHSPHIDAFAKSGMRFERAYCQQAVCNPSRTSLMTGMRPDSIGVTGNHSHFRDAHPDVVTLPQHFKRHGYHAAAIGKIYHGVFPDGASITKWDTMGDPPSWSVPAIRFGPRYYYTEAGIAAAKDVYQRIYKPTNPGPSDWTKKLVFGPATESPDVADNVLYDGQVADAAIKTLRELSLSEKPFFLAVGFIKPHSPYIAPQKYFARYQDVALPSQPAFPHDAPSLAGHGSGELRRYTDQPKRGEFSEAQQKRVRQAYFACVTYIDAQIGRVLEELERNGLSKNTIVALFGDHGYHLGEQGLWGKTTNFELDTRVPLILRAPGMQAAGKSCQSLIELVDLYPTLAELAGLPILKQLEGRSFAANLDDPARPTKPVALSQFPRGRGLMGYSMRTETHRLTHWVHRQSGQIRHTELYDYGKGLVETANVATTSRALVEQLTPTWKIAFASSLAGSLAGQASTQPATTPDKPATADSQAAKELDDFESAQAGRFQKLRTRLGEWHVESGNAIVDDKHAKTGKQCLQLTGGKRTTVILNLADNVKTNGALSFWAERWTKRSPFSFRIEKDSGPGWKEIYNGDRQVRVGRAFLSHVKVPLGDDKIKRLRFSVVSPPNTGILIDDLRIAPARPQEIVKVEVTPLTIPALVGNQASPLLKLIVETQGQLNPVSLREIQAELDQATHVADLAQLQLRRSQSTSSRFLDSTEIATLDVNAIQDRSLLFSNLTQAIPLSEGVNVFWIAAKLDEKANIDHRIGVSCRQLKFSNGKNVQLKSEPSIQRMGVAVRNRGDDGVNTYRIPGLATTNKGTLIGVYDVRRRSGGDLPGDIDVGMSRSTDGGRTWESMKVIMDMGDDPNWRYDGIGDPAVLVDRQTGAIWVAATWSHGNRSWRGSGPGLKPEETGQLMLVRSDDDGVTWSKPINITKQVKKPEWCFILQGPGKGITMRDGTIVFAAQYQDPPEKRRLPHSTIIYSKDHGRTWSVGTGAFDDTTEAQVVEIEPGVLMLNCRYNRRGVRVVMTTRDMGKTWKKHTTSERALIEPGACMASLIDVDQEVGKRLGWLLFSNPDSTRGRHHITIKASPDRGLTWPKQHRLLLDEENSAGYSCMSMIDESTVGILYEGSQAHMTFQRIPLSDIVGSRLNNSAVDAPPRPALRLPQVFSDHMVLQADAQLPVWGFARAGAKVTVRLGEEEQTATTDRQGKWQVRFSPRTASAKPIVLTVASGGDQIVLRDILLGEVWICAGQSNMEWMLRQSSHGQEELASASHPQLRLLHLVGGARGSSGSYTPQHLSRLTPNNYCRGQWQVASAESASSFSAVGWYFGRRLQQQLKVPVGLICPAVGGTPTEAWIPREALQQDPDLRGLVAGNWLDNPRLGDFCRSRGEQNLLAAIQAGEFVPADEFGPNHSFKPGFMWEAGIRPLIPFAFRGAVWYQGESNAESPERVREHGRLLPLLIHQWRREWGQGEFPFLYVQLPALNRPEWPWFRDGQRRTLGQLNNLGMATTIDTGHPSNVHPSLKKPVGQRLARWALGTTYERPSQADYSGPLFEAVKRNGDSLLVTFKHTADGLKSADGRPLRYFEVCGADGKFWPANAKIAAANTLSVSSSRVAAPQHVRYAWLPFPNPPVNLFNSADLPASPFTSETEELVYTRRMKAQDSQAKGRDARPNILLIVSEDNGPELGCYGDKFARTPNLDQLAGQGVRFETAYVTQSVCSPSRSTIFTGLYPHQNGQIGLATHQFEMFRAWPTTYSILKKAGYRTGLLGKTHVNPPNVIEDFVDFRRIKSSNFAKKNLGDYAKESAAFINASDSPFFLTVNFPDAHWPVQNQVQGRPKSVLPTAMTGPMPYIGFDNERLRGHLTGFYNCMSRLDECVGELLNELERSGKADNTLVIYIGDHGAQFARGKVFVTEGGLRIPFIVRWPGKAKAGLVSKQMVSTVDLLPTIVAAAGAKTPGHAPGVNLAAALTGEAKPIRDYLFGERNSDSADLHFPQRAIRDSRYKLIKTLLDDRFDPGAQKCLANGASNFRGSPTFAEIVTASKRTQDAYETWFHPPQYQLYDLQNDPHEYVNLANDPKLASVKNRLIQRLEKWQLETDDRLRLPEMLKRLTAETDACRESKIRSPKGGWKYIEYLAPKIAKTVPPKNAQVIFQQRDIPDSVPRLGHAKDAKRFGYRIPSLLVTQKGSVLAFSERRLGLHDHAQNDIVLRRSTDNGKTWSDEIIAFEDGMNSINDPLTVQLESGRILLMFARFPYGRHARSAGWIKMAELGYDDPQTNVLTFLCHSDDDGQTWSKPVDISRQVKHPKLLNANTPGAMIQLTRGPHKGRIVTGLWGTLPTVKEGKQSREWRIVAAYSDDNGQSWQRTEPLIDESGQGFPNECQVAEASNGDLILVSRNQGGERFRKKAISRDGGQTWSALDIDRGLPSVACMGSLIKGPLKADGGWDLWASFPSNTGRKNGQIVVSQDHGQTWRIAKVVPGPFAYSALQVSPDRKSLLCLYESNGYRNQTLLTIPFESMAPPRPATSSARPRRLRQGDKPNVLFISVDDWNDWVGCLGHKQAQTPNVDRLANRGLLFTNAHCVAPVCNPSRVATLTGLRPETTGVYENNHVMRRKAPNVVTLPQHFREQGYHVVGGGKVFHDVPPHCDDPKSWDDYFWWNEHGARGERAGGRWRSPYSIPPDPQPSQRPTRQITSLTKRNFDWGTVDQPESDWPDSKVAKWASEFLAKEHDRPFFLSVGIFRPHVPWFNPKNYVDKHPLDRLQLPAIKLNDLDDLGDWAKQRAHDRASRHERLVEFAEWKLAVQAYLASISFADANVGRVLDALQNSQYRDNTIVVFWSDHGYHLGEKGHWHKRTLWERSTHVPLIVTAPNVTAAGGKCSRPVSLLDLYPTLVSLCKLQRQDALQGHDLTPLLLRPNALWPHPAMTTWNPGNHSVRTEHWRYIRYRNGEEELYDHRSDPNEWTNLAADPKHAGKKAELERFLPSSQAASKNAKAAGLVPGSKTDLATIQNAKAFAQGGLSGGQR